MAYQSISRKLIYKTRYYDNYVIILITLISLSYAACCAIENYTFVLICRQNFVKIIEIIWIFLSLLYLECIH